MSEDHVQIFISYARDDDLTNPDIPNAKGFVSFLERQLKFGFVKRGPFRPDIWRDIRGVEKAEQFDPKIQEAINASSILLIVLSPNWMTRPYCKLELEMFRDRWASEGELGVRRRIVVVGKRFVDLDKRPSLLQGQQSYEFFSMNDPDSPGLLHEFVGPTGPQDARCLPILDELVEYLLRLAGRMEKPRPAAPQAQAIGHTVFVAKPAGDMRKAYDRVVDALAGRGYKVVPDPKLDLADETDTPPLEAIDKALAEAEVSIHLLGKNRGFTPEGCDKPLAVLQLERAKERITPFVDNSDVRNGFHRVIWAPRTLDGDTNTEPRDPLEVLTTFAPRVDGDCIGGDSLSDFIEFLGQHLVRTPVKAQSLGEIDADSRVYIYHRTEDTDYAFHLAELLQQRNVNALLPASDGTDQERVQLDNQYLRDCDSVILCWAAAPEVWIKAASHKLVDWRSLGRSRMFARRGVVAGPPPGLPKNRFVRVFPKNEIDVVLDLTAQEQPQPEDLDPLLSSA
jgi:hypothetical protein